jgi:uncharacterized membrane protein
MEASMPQNVRDSQPEEKSRINWKAIFKSQEVDILCAGILCALGILGWFLYLQHVDGRKAAKMVAVITTHVSLGRAAGVSMAIGAHEFSRLETIILGSLIEGTVVCVFFAAFCLSCKKLIRLPWLDTAIRNVRASARRQRRHLLGWGIPGLIAFVWFPFLMTGPVVGSVIGYLLGMRPWVVICTVMFGTISAIVSWTFLMNAVSQWAQMVGNYVPAAIVIAILTVILIFRVRHYRRQRQAKANGRKPAAPKPATAEDEKAAS